VSRFSVLFPMLQSENVCDEIIEAIRKDENLLLIPKVLRLGLFLKRFERKEICTLFIIDSYCYLILV